MTPKRSRTVDVIFLMRPGWIDFESQLSNPFLRSDSIDSIHSISNSDHRDPVLRERHLASRHPSPIPTRSFAVVSMMITNYPTHLFQPLYYRQGTFEITR